ncbi:single-stranded-DNA-specific exonuclease RecJ [Candidatus Peregrinibacteria bacterium]|nr:single-stranded-DNA-specific exonuclease RecJ [Candidatus Peregrinibacteria bacterium]
MSLVGKTWKIKNTDKNKPLMARLLENRGLTDETEIQHFFYPDEKRDFHDPFLMKDMKRAVERIGLAIEKSERVMVFGDYDVDGITGSAILMRTLAKLGANVSYRLPHRIEDGYGLREKFIREFAKLDVKLIITTDNGISCFNEVELANKNGMDVIITDHHTIPEKLPNAYAILHPKLPDSGYPFADLTGAGVALKLAQALFTTRLKTDPKIEIKKLLDLACMGTIGDLGALRGENRYIVKEGLKVLDETRWPGLSRLKEYAGIRGKIDTHEIGFLLGPRINAAGRISHPSHALKLLLCDVEHTHVLAETLEQLNHKRQRMMEEIMGRAEFLAAKQASESIIIIADKEFHGGIIGLIASKIVDKYSRPAIVMEKRGDILVGSCRSVASVNIVEAIGSAKEFLTHFGGHAAAAGFDLPKGNLKPFTERVREHIGKTVKNGVHKPILSVDCELPHSDVSMRTVNMIKTFAPFGMENEVPRFVCNNIEVHEYGTVGSGDRHLKLKAKLNGTLIDCIGFNLGKFAEKFKGLKKFDAVCKIEENEWRGNKKVQLKLVDLKI